MVRPAIATVTLITFIGPWNEFLWPFLITKDATMQPLAVALANYITNIAQTVANPNGAILAGVLRPRPARRAPLLRCSRSTSPPPTSAPA
jgi:ABC-type glycerol-3-phosphate transport system permease component